MSPWWHVLAKQCQAEALVCIMFFGYDTSIFRKRDNVVLFELYMTWLFLKFFHLLMCCCLIELLSLASIIYFMVGLICLNDLGWSI